MERKKEVSVIFTSFVHTTMLFDLFTKPCRRFVPSLLQFFITLSALPRNFPFLFFGNSSFSLTWRVSFDLAISLGNEENLLTHFFHSRSFYSRLSLHFFASSTHWLQLVSFWCICTFMPLVFIEFWVREERKADFFLLPSFYLPVYRFFPSLKKGWEEASEWKVMRRLVLSRSSFPCLTLFPQFPLPGKEHCISSGVKSMSTFSLYLILFFFLSHSKKKERNIIIKEKRNRHLRLFETGIITENKSTIFPSMDRRMDYSCYNWRLDQESTFRNERIT